MNTVTPLTDGRAEAILAEIAELPEGHGRREALRAELVALHTGYARSVARRYAGRGESLDDLEQAAMLGLVKAINRFDPHLGERFLGYAAPVITGEVKRHFRDRTWTVRVSRHLQEQRVRLRDAVLQFEQEHQRSPKLPELAEILNLPLEEVIEVVGTADAYRPASLDVPISADGDGSATVADLIGGLDGGLERVVDLEALQPLLAKLPERDRTILVMRFWGNKTQSEIADHLQISQMHVSRLLSRSLAYLRKEMLRDA